MPPKINDTLATYAVQRGVMDMALQHAGLQYRCKTKGDAIKFCQKCNKLRMNLRKQQEARNEGVVGAIAETVYDVLTIRRIDDLIVQFDHNVLKGELFDAEGNKLEYTPPTLAETRLDTSPVEGEFDHELSEAVKNLGLDL